MRAFLAIVVLLAVAAGAWYFRGLWLPQELASRLPGAGGAAHTEPGRSPEASTAAGAAPGEPSGTTGGQLAPAAVVREQAQRFVATLTEPEPEPVRVERADHFVTSEQVLSLIPTAAVEETTVARMQSDATLTPDTPITVVREVDQVERTTPEKLIAQSGGNLDAPVRVLDSQGVRETTVRELLERARRAPDAPIDVVTRTEYYEQTTPRELAQRADVEPDKPIRIIRKHHAVEVSSVGDLMRLFDVSEDSLYYVRTVRPGDHQGIWGIVHDGIIKNFARGMAIRRGKEVNTYKVDIPVDADERNADASSSFLGRLIFRKTRESYVYNFGSNRMGRNPDRIYPGQEIVIINFDPEELVRIYSHFVEQRG